MIGPDASSLKLIDEIIQIKKSYQGTRPAGTLRNDNIIPAETKWEDGKVREIRGAKQASPRKDQRRESTAAAR
jgi:hypothetical protein